MKAYMSDPDNGITSLRPDLYASDLEFLARESVHEARRILADAEPADANRFYNPGLGPGYWSCFEIGEFYPNTSPMADAGSALAEALAAFVSA